MNTLVKKMSRLGILKLEIVLGTLVMAAAFILLPVAIIVEDAELLLNPYVLGVVLIGMLAFGSVAYFLFIRPYVIYKKLPAVLAETDGECIYICSKKKTKIPLSALDGAVVTYVLPFIYSNEFIAVLMVNFFSEKYGDLILDVPGYGSYKMRFVSNVQDAARQLTAFIRRSVNPIKL